MTEFELLLQEVMPKIEKLSVLAEENSVIDNSFYYNYDVKRGLRDINGRGVLAGLTEISDIQSWQRDENGKTVTDENGNRIPCNGILRYRGIDIKDLVRGCVGENRYGFEEIVYLLLFGELPSEKQLKSFKKLLGGFRTLPISFVRDVIMKAPSTDMMNGLARSVLTMYSYDDFPDDISISNVLRQCLQLISQMPLMAVYSYQVYKYYHEYNSLIIHKPRPELSTAESMLALLRDDENFSDLYNFFNDNQPHYRVEVVTEPSKPVKHKKENLDTKSLKARLNIINNELDNSIKSRVNGLISLAETMHANGLDNSADILYIEVINLMETTLLKDYLIEEYTNIKEQQHIDK